MSDYNQDDTNAGVERSSKELSPCPFCGGKAEVVRIGSRHQSTIIACSDCGCRLESADEGDQHGNTWNGRASSEPADDVARLKRLLKSVFNHWLDDHSPNELLGLQHEVTTVLTTSSAQPPDVERMRVALRAIYDTTAEDGLHENKALFLVAMEGLGYSGSTKAAERVHQERCSWFKGYRCDCTAQGE